MKKILFVLLFVSFSLATALVAKVQASVLYPSQMDIISNGDGRADVNFQWDLYLTVSWWDGQPSKGLLQFDVDSLSDSNISDATLSLYHKYNKVEGAVFGIYRVTSPWEQSKVTWNTSPTIDETPAAVLIINDDNEEIWREWDITGLVQGWVSGEYPNYGIEIARIDAVNPGAYFLANYDEELIPRLTIGQEHVIPEPATFFLFGSGLASIAMIRKKLLR